MGTGEPYMADAYMIIIEDAEARVCTYCNVAFPRNTMIDDIKQFAKEVMPSFM